MEKEFADPPLAALPRALWPWVNGNVSLSQITYELEQVKEKGMGGLDIWHLGAMVNADNILTAGPAFLSDECLQAIAHATREAERLGLEIGLITSSSWNAGGSWVKPEHGAMGIYESDTVVNGPMQFAGNIPDPKATITGYSKDVAVLAYPVTADSVIGNISNVIQLTANNNHIQWNVPAGKWRIVKYKCYPTAQRLAIPGPGSDGLALDHFSAEAQRMNMQYVITRLKSVLGDLHNRSLKYLVEDSYEVNSGVWTPLLPEEFQKRKGYSLIPFLPALKGFTVIDEETTKRFLHDFSKLLSDLIIENHYVVGTSLAKKEGMGFYAEAGGPGKPIHNVPFEDLKALGSLTVPRGEFWNKHPQLELLQIVKGIASAAHIYNQRYVEAESFTSVWLWQEGPGELKSLADRAMCEGLNRFVYHTFSHSPPESGIPGWIYNFGTIINTTNGWWPKSKGFHQYLARSSYLLQQGNFVGDVAFYYGDQAPNFVAPKHIPATLGFGYDYDVVNTDAILNKMTVKNGRIYLPHGQSYAVLALPNETTINLQVLKKLEQLVAAGMTLIGPKPERTYGLQNARSEDSLIKAITSKLWGKADGQKVFENKYGKGKLVSGKTVREVLMEKGIQPDLLISGQQPDDSIDFIHRSTDSLEIYFIRNTRVAAFSANAHFRIRNTMPEWWDAETGAIYPINYFKQDSSGITIPLSLPPHGAGFVVFRKSNKQNTVKWKNDLRHVIYTAKGIATTDVQNLPPPAEVSGPWDIRFEKRTGSPLADTTVELVSWHRSEKDGIKYFSGTAAYHNDFDISTLPEKGQVLLLELHKVKEIAEVYLNGERLGYHWHHSHRFDITNKVKPGGNKLVIEVINSINNLLVGDAKLPAALRQTRSNIAKLPNAWSKPFAEAPLIEAGLIGPVIIRWARLVE